MLVCYAYWDGPTVFTAERIAADTAELVLFRFYEEGSERNRLFRADTLSVVPGRLISAYEDEIDFTNPVIR